MYLHTLGATLVEDRLYFVSCDFNALFCMDLKEKRIEYKTYFAAYAKYRRELYAKQILYRNKIYFIPRTCNKIAIYDIETEKTVYVEIRDKGEGAIRDAFIEDNYLWMLCAEYPANIFKVNLSTNKYQVLNINWEQVATQIGYSEQTMSPLERNSVFGSARQVGKYWWLFAEAHGYLIAYDWRGNKTSAYSFPALKGKMMTGNVQEKVWIIARDKSEVLEFDYKTNTEKWIELPEIGQIPGDIMRIIEQDEYLLFIKQKGIISVSKKAYRAKCFMFQEEKNLLGYVVYNGKMILPPLSGRGLILFDLSENKIEEYALEWDEKLTNRNLEEVFSGCIEETVCELKEFVELAPIDRKNNFQINGNKIWDVLCGG